MEPTLKKSRTSGQTSSRITWQTLLVVWLKEFQQFEDKSAAINHVTGLNKRLIQMIKRWCAPGEVLAVGKPEYKEIIDGKKDLGITCRHDDAVMEVMWGLKNVMHSLVPQEKAVLTKEYRLPLSKGLEMFLCRYNFDVNQEMVNDHMVVTACILYDCDLREKKHYDSLHMVDHYLFEISGLDTRDWDIVKHATVLKMICYPEENIEYPSEMFTPGEISRIRADAPKYKDNIIKSTTSILYREVLYLKKVRAAKVKEMKLLIKEAKEALKNEPGKSNMVKADDCDDGFSDEATSSDYERIYLY